MPGVPLDVVVRYFVASGLLRTVKCEELAIHTLVWCVNRVHPRAPWSALHYRFLCDVWEIP